MGRPVRKADSPKEALTTKKFSNTKQHFDVISVKNAVKVDSGQSKNAYIKSRIRVE